MEDYKLAIILTAIFGGISMMFIGMSAVGVWCRVYIAYKDYKLKERRYKSRNK